MAEQNHGEQLDRFVEGVIANPRVALPNADAELASLARIAADLRGLPREEFKERLKSDLIRRASMASGTAVAQEAITAVTPYLCVRDAAAALEFYKRAFGAVETLRLRGPGPKIGHAEIRIGNAVVMLSDEFPNYDALSPQTVGGSPVRLHLYVPDVDAFVSRAEAAGAKIVRPVRDEFYGDRTGQIADPFGYSWSIATHKEDLSAEEIQRRIDAMTGGAEQKEGGVKPVISPVPIGAKATASPRLTFRDAGSAIEFYTRALGARETFRFEAGGHIAHAEIAVDDSVIMLSEEWPEGGRLSAETLGNSPVWLSLRVDDVDTFAERAIAAGMKVKRAISNQFYGHRDVLLMDPFGYTWSVFTVTEEMSVEEMHRRLKGETIGPEGGTLPGAIPEEARVSPIPRGFRTLQPYLVAADGPALLDFIKDVFDAEETCRIIGNIGGVHGETQIGDTMLMAGGGVPGRTFEGKLKSNALHVYVRDTDAVYAKALAAGATSIGEPQDHEYGERGAGVKDAAGNYWYIATHKGESYIPKGLHSVNIYLHPRRAEPLIRFLKQAFGAQEEAKYASPDGVIHHAVVRVNDSVVEMGEAHGPYQPMESMFYLYVPDTDAVYQRALGAGAKTLQEPKDQPYGDRNAAVTDPFGNTWYIATHVRDVQP